MVSGNKHHFLLLDFTSVSPMSSFFLRATHHVARSALRQFSAL
jgi:hypothetical protein